MSDLTGKAMKTAAWVALEEAVSLTRHAANLLKDVPGCEPLAASCIARARGLDELRQTVAARANA